VVFDCINGLGSGRETFDDRESRRKQVGQWQKTRDPSPPEALKGMFSWFYYIHQFLSMFFFHLS